MGIRYQESLLRSIADATGRAPARATPSATSRSVEATMTGRPGGSARTSWRISSSQVTPG